MATTIALVSCVKRKRKEQSPARDLYVSPLFRALRRHAETHADAWFILSAEHGLVNPDTPIEPYEKTLNGMAQRDRLAWAVMVQQQLLDKLPAGAKIMILAGERYREHLAPFLKQNRWEIDIPLEKLRMGQQLRRLNELAAATQHAR